ncbi:MAG: NADPH:quinone reductase-like Zn-dependent oxidoreductase [Alcanivorax sp.]|jgi:NADPH:quinone reductase-like Zn-dependent oxidoreductase
MAGNEDKCAWLTEELGFDAAINYKTCGDYQSAISAACPEGVDVYFDNVGGEILEAALMCLDQFGRVAVCGWISSYHNIEAPGVANWLSGLWPVNISYAKMWWTAWTLSCQLFCVCSTVQARVSWSSEFPSNKAVVYLNKVLYLRMDEGG